MGDVYDAQYEDYPGDRGTCNTPPVRSNATLVLAVDPGPKQCGVVVLDTRWQTIVYAGHKAVEDLMADMRAGYVNVVFEKIVGQGKPVGSSVFETIYQTGRLAHAAEAAGSSVHRVTRTEVKQHLSVRKGDSQVRAALLKRWGGPQAAKGTLKQVTGHAWSALAVAVTWADRAQSSGAIPPRVNP